MKIKDKNTANFHNAARRVRKTREQTKAGTKLVPDVTDEEALSTPPSTIRGGPRPDNGRVQDMVSKTSATARGGPRPSPGRERALGPQHTSAQRPRGAPQPEPSRVGPSQGSHTGTCSCGKHFVQSSAAVRHFTKMGYPLRFRCFACSDAKKHCPAAHVSRSAAAANSSALPLPEHPPATPPGSATFPSEEHGAASAAADLAPQLAAAQAQLREQQSAISALQDKHAENTAQLASALVELRELRRQCAPPPTSLAPVEPRPTSDDWFFPASPDASMPLAVPATPPLSPGGTPPAVPATPPLSPGGTTRAVPATPPYRLAAPPPQCPPRPPYRLAALPSR
jgi:hypothetical protein